jgi:cytochrome c-type biogenesis protein CcmH
MRRWTWLLMAVVLAGALAVGLQPDDEPRTQEERVFALAETLKCPTCRSQSVADSEAPSAEAIRGDIARRLAEGQDEDEIRDYLVGRFGEEILLTPSSSGLTGLVWILPVVAVVLAAAGLALAFRRWRRSPTVAVTEEDRERVAEARTGG